MPPGAREYLTGAACAARTNPGRFAPGSDDYDPEDDTDLGGAVRDVCPVRDRARQKLLCWTPNHRRTILTITIDRGADI